MYYILIATVVIILSILYVTISKRKDESKIFGVYSQPGKWFYLKYYFLLFKLGSKRLKYQLLQSTTRFGNKLKIREENLEKLQQLSEHEKAFDAVFFQGVNSNGFYFCGGLERRHKGKANGLMYLVVPNIGLLKSEKLPKTVLNADPASLYFSKEYSAEGIKFIPVEPMKSWKILLSGKMISEAINETYNVHFEADWHSNNYPYFLYERDLSVKAISRALAAETWSRNFFDNLKKNKQNHYEQMGKLNGKLTVNNTEHHIEMDAFRDHSFGYKRDWTLLHRYAFHMMYLEDGTRVSLGVISYPSTMTHFEVGYVVTPDKNIYAIDECNLKLYQHGENGKPGRNIGFSFKANGCKFDVKATTLFESLHYKGNDIEAKLIERFLTYEVNGIKGRGIAEWSYNNTKNKN